MPSTTFEICLKNPGKPVYVEFPESFRGQRTSEEYELSIDTSPRALSRDEIDFVKQYIALKRINNELRETGAIFLAADDPLLNLSHQQLDRLEQSVHLPNTRQSKAGGERSVLERVLLIRGEGRYDGNGEVANGLLAPSQEELPPESTPVDKKEPTPLVDAAREH